MTGYRLIYVYTLRTLLIRLLIVPEHCSETDRVLGRDTLNTYVRSTNQKDILILILSFFLLFVFLEKLEKGVRQQKENDLNLAEDSISQALKILSASANNSDVNREKARCFHSLAEVYFIRASQQTKREGFSEMMVKCIGLFEAEKIYKHVGPKEEEDINTVVLEAEIMFIEKMFRENGVKRFKEAKDRRILNQNKLNEIRLKISSKYLLTLEKLPDWNSEDVKRRCDEIENIYEEIHDDMKNFIADIFLYCSEIAGPAPCNYSIIGLGSTSRKEGTPYSDLEFAILLDESEEKGKNIKQEQREYFRFLTYFIEIQIIKLGETILPSLGIASLNDFYSENTQDDWFFDDVIPKGFSFDGMMPWACKTPLGKKEWRGQPAQEYIMTIDEMLELQNVPAGSSAESFQTANVFSRVCHLFGDENLTEAYQQRLSTLFTDAEQKTVFQRQVLDIMQGLSDKYRIEFLTSDSFGTQQDVKKEVYRLSSLLIEQLSKFFGIFGRSSWQCIREMNEKNIITDIGAKNLVTTLSITTELRLQCYQKHGRQKEALPTVPQLSLTKMQATPCSSTLAIVRLYESLPSLKGVVTEILDVMKSRGSLQPESIALSVLKEVNFIDRSSIGKAMAYLRILQVPQAINFLQCAKSEIANDAEKVQLLLALAYCYHMIGKFQKVSKCCLEVQTLYLAMPDAVGKSNLLKALTICINACTDLGLYEEAMEICKQMIELTDKLGFQENSFNEELDFLNSCAVLYIDLNQHKKAEVILKSAFEKLPNPQKNYSKYLICINNLAVIYVHDDRLIEARTVVNNALRAASELYGENAFHPHVARCLSNLGQINYLLQNTEEANRLLQWALIIYGHFHEEKIIEPAVIDTLIIKANVYKLVGKFDEMYSTLKEAKEIAEILYGNLPHPYMASVLNNLGYCEQLRGRLRSALNHYQDCLKIRENQKGQCKGNDYNCKTATLLLRIAILGTSCSYDASYLLSLVHRALEMEETIHGKGSNHEHLAMCFNRLGYFMMKESRGAEGLEYLKKAIEMFEKMNLDHTNSYGDIQVTTGMVLTDFLPNEAEKHLRIGEKVFKTNLKSHNNYLVFLPINTSLLQIYIHTNRLKDGLELAKRQKRLLDSMLSESAIPNLHPLYHVFWLSLFYEASGQRIAARELCIDLIERLEHQIDPKDAENVDTMFFLWLFQETAGEIYQSDEMFSEAEAMLRRCFESTQTITSEQPFVKKVHMIARCNLASICIETGKYFEAYDLINDIINKYEKDQQSINVIVVSSAFHLRGELNRRRGRWNLSLQDLENALKLAEEFGATAATGISSKGAKETYAKVMNTIGLVYEQTGDSKRALHCYQRCLDTTKGMHVTRETASFHQNAADALKALGRLNDALLHYNKSLEIREILYSEDPVREDIATVLYHIAVTQFINNRPKEASETLEKLLPLRQKLLAKGGCLQNYCAVLILKGNCHIVEPNQVQQAKDTYEEAEKVLKRMTEGQSSLDYATVVSNIGQYILLV